MNANLLCPHLAVTLQAQLQAAITIKSPRKNNDDQVYYYPFYQIPIHPSIHATTSPKPSPCTLRPPCIPTTHLSGYQVNNEK